MYIRMELIEKTHFRRLITLKLGLLSNLNNTQNRLGKMMKRE
jgi:hypothetical protein